MRLFTLILSFAVFVLAGTAHAETVTEKLEQRKANFAEKAPAEKLKDYEEGVRQVAESGVLERAINVGDTAPDFTLPNAAGESVTLSELLKDGPVVMIWYRGEWCPYCNIYLEDIQAHAQEFKDAGANVVAISPETPDRGWTLQDKLDLDFHILSDEKSAIAQEYGVVYTLPEKIAGYLQEAFDIHEKNKDDRNLLPLGASYVISQDGVVTYAFIDPDYRKRAETEILLEEVKALPNKEK